MFVEGQVPVRPLSLCPRTPPQMSSWLLFLPQRQLIYRTPRDMSIRTGR